MRSSRWLVIVLLVAATVASCAKFQAEILPLPDDPADYDPISSYDTMAIPADNPLTPLKAALGRQLYHDSRLSGDGSRSCYHCHVEEQGLTDGLPTAIGAYERPLSRSSPTLWNIGYHQSWYWDGRAATLEAQAKGAWTGGNMGAKDTAPVLEVLNGIPAYRAQFEAVFGGPADELNVTRALATYMRTLISDNTAWDRFVGGDAAALTAQQQRGWTVFQEAGCRECHAGVLFTDLQFHNVGIGMQAENPDVGRYKVTQRDQDTGAFKTPTLRDVTRSAPYFHDGSVATLEQAVELMAGGGLANPWLRRDKLKQNRLDASQLADLVAFLGALEQPPVVGVTAPPLP